MKQHWLNEWESREDRQADIAMYREHLKTALIEASELEDKLKAVEYRIEMLRDKLLEIC